ncbi:hypothetical protein [Streptomyces flaveolus]|uniref:hypothetical protein n=1 Tax=Streptomyces flaveolus TaxID=67297 RepID=UPI00166F7F3C|nr:hypothetical protein [Streptomyces flaveolus]GGQ99957.1 hypothetical protein GCM10010216_72580 [Streptomyces flaveolus]
MDEPEVHPSASRDACNVTHKVLHCNARTAADHDRPAGRSREAWRHPSIVAALIGAAATVTAAVITAVVSVMLVKML